jgi:hypothetical protein
MAPGEPIAIDEAVLDADLRERVAAIDTSAPGAVPEIWQAFLGHAARPLRWEARFQRDDDNDLLQFGAEIRARPGVVRVDIERRVGVVENEDYQGTIVVICRLTFAGGPEWDPVGDRVGYEHYGVTGGELAAFRDEVEASPAFAAMRASRITQFFAGAYYG